LFIGSNCNQLGNHDEDDEDPDDPGSDPEIAQNMPMNDPTRAMKKGKPLPQSELVPNMPKINKNIKNNKTTNETLGRNLFMIDINAFERTMKNAVTNAMTTLKLRVC
jgi:hypothetical protein